MNEETTWLRVLLVDDEEDFLAATARVLRRRSMDVLIAASGERALELLGVVDIDVVVLDVKMPGMGGEKVFERISSSSPSLPVIMLTGHGSIPQAFRMSKGGVAEYLAKPCDVDSLATKIRRAASASATASAPPPEGVSVLLVDDEEALLQSLQKVLVRRGMEVATASSGERALELLGAVEVDVVVLDVKMPGIDGLQTLQSIKSRFPDREVILLTGHPDVSNAVRGIELGAMEYLTKPPDILFLTELIGYAYRKRLETIDQSRQCILDGVLDRQPD